MAHFNRLWHWVLVKNPTGLACLLTIWGVGIFYTIVALAGLVPQHNIPLALKFCGASGLALFVVMPFVIRICRA